jgi:hypothetical protein
VKLFDKLKKGTKDAPKEGTEEAPPEAEERDDERPPENTPIDPATGKPYKSGEYPLAKNEPVP